MILTAFQGVAFRVDSINVTYA